MPPPVEGLSSHYFTREAAETCARDIREAGGVEVFFVGRRDETGLVTEVESHAYGNQDTVPALTRLARPGEVVIHNHPSGGLMPSEADLSIAAEMGNLGIGFLIIDNECSQCRTVVRPQDAQKKKPVEEEDIVARLTPTGGVAKVLEHFEDRPQQRDMARAVVRSFNHDGIGVIEAGTGTGKSLAYLLPAILYALRNNERIVISTNTINLQEQLLNKDIPAIRRAVGEEFQVEIVKGRGNYVCKRKAEYARQESQNLIEDDFQRELKEVLDWATTSPTGDRNDLSIPPRTEVWERVQSEADNCLRLRCPFYEECFFYNSRRRAARAKLLIVNHALLMSDLAVRRASNNYSMAAVLPPYTRLVIDEAHHLEEAATKNLASQITRPGLRRMLGRLYRKESGGGGRGVLTSLQEELEPLAKKNQIDFSDDRIQRLLFEAVPRVSDVRDSLEQLLSDFGEGFLQSFAPREVRPGLEHKIRLKPAMTKLPDWREELAPLLGAMASELSEFVDAQERLRKSFDDFPEEVINAIINPLTEWQAIIGRLDATRRIIHDFLGESDRMCRWVEVGYPTVENRGRGVTVRLCIAPVDVRELLQESLHDRMKSEVMTSATLTVDRTFDFFRERTGIPRISAKEPEPQYDEEGLPIIDRTPAEARPVETNLLGSPFDYRKQVFFAVPKDLPDPREPQFEDDFAELVNRSIAITGGRAFVLFTSYGQLNRVYRACESTIRRLGIEPLRQGSENRERLLARFREDETSVLFATSSFWEGVDVKGRALELLIIARLPFSVPTEPVQEAQFEALQAQGRDPFDNLVVPRAVIRLKQGFGRLIRARTDRGAVIVADRRVIQMRYGRRFLHSLPPIDVRQGPSEELLTQMRTFFETPTPVDAGQENHHSPC